MHGRSRGPFLLQMIKSSIRKGIVHDVTWLDKRKVTRNFLAFQKLAGLQLLSAAG